jgi:hypothetical protein
VSTADAPLRSNVRLLGDVLGNVLVEQEGEELLVLEEQIRSLARDARETGERAALEETIGALSLEQQSAVLRAFSIFFQLANIAEQHHRLRRRRQYEHEGRVPRESLADAVARLREAGVGDDELLAAVARLEVRPVLTAHPTEASRRTILQAHQRLATALIALKTLGPQHRFATGVWTDGVLDKTTGTINGNLYISGSDPSFHYEHAVLLARELNTLGITKVSGDLIVSPSFTMNFNSSVLGAGVQLYDTLNSTLRYAEAIRAWDYERTLLKDVASLQTNPSVAIAGKFVVGAVTPNARLLLTQKSSRLVDILKVLLCYSNNFMAARIGETLGGQHFTPLGEGEGRRHQQSRRTRRARPRTRRGRGGR